MQKKIAIVYFSAFGGTKNIAENILSGTITNYKEHIQTDIYQSNDIDDPFILNKYDAIIFGAPTYMGSVPAEYKKFMDQTSQIWFNQEWSNKVAAGFTNSGAINGDKFNVLVQLCTFACQHSMTWLPLGIKSNGSSEDSINRFGSSIGLMAQCDNLTAELNGDNKTAFLFGERISKHLLDIK